MKRCSFLMVQEENGFYFVRRSSGIPATDARGYLSETEIMHHVAKGEISLINVFGEDKVKDCQQKMKFLKTMKYRASIR